MDTQQVTLAASDANAVSTILSCVLDIHLKVIFFVIYLCDCVLGLFGIKQLTGATSKHVCYILSVIGYVWLLKENRERFKDDVSARGFFVLTSSFTLDFLWRTYEVHVTCAACRFYRQVKIYGSLRVFVYVLSVVLTALLVVNIADVSTTFVTGRVSGEVIGRLDDNVIEIEEGRQGFGEVTIHPITKGEKDPKILTKLYRYPLEDVQMTCEFKTPWLPGASPANDQVIWRRNGVPLIFTDRHTHQLSVREDQEGNTIVGAIYRKYGLHEYEVNSTLTIYLLRESEFGSYTCHNAWYMNTTLRDFIENAAKRLNKTTDTQQGEHVKTKRARSYKPQNPVDKKRLFKGEFIQKGEFRLIKIPRKQEIIRAPASSILHFTTSYWHLSWRDEVEIDYSVNKQSYYNLCPDGYFHGCSKFLSLYWYFGHKVGGRFGIPPLQLFTIWKDPDYPAERFSLVHCLCENAYGYHNVKYLRRYYNSTSKRSELIEILHPHTLAVAPREQKMLHLFVNRSQCSPIIEQPVCEKPPSVCKQGWDFQTIKEFAEAAVFYFHWIELVAITTFSILGCFAFRQHNLFLAFLGRYIRLFILEGSMGFLSTAEITGTLPLNKKPSPEEQAVEDVYYDVYLSYSEAETDMAKVHNEIVPHLETRGLKVCVRERDIPVNLPEIQAISKAMKNSTKFVIFLSKAYFEDNFRKDFEAAMIFETACDRTGGSDAILVVKLNTCEMPAWLNHLKVHDWTAFCLSLQDHLLRLLKWLEPRERRSTVRSKIDACFMVLPLFGVMFVGVLVFLAAPE